MDVEKQTTSYSTIICTSKIGKVVGIIYYLLGSLYLQCLK